MSIDKKAKGKFVNQRSRRAWTPETVTHLIEAVDRMRNQVLRLADSNWELVQVIREAIAPPPDPKGSWVWVPEEVEDQPEADE